MTDLFDKLDNLYAEIAALSPKSAATIAEARKRLEVSKVINDLLAIPAQDERAAAGPFVAGASKRELALRYAVESCDKHAGISDLIATAEAFEEFLSR